MSNIYAVYCTRTVLEPIQLTFLGGYHKNQKKSYFFSRYTEGANQLIILHNNAGNLIPAGLKKFQERRIQMKEDLVINRPIACLLAPDS